MTCTTTTVQQSPISSHTFCLVIRINHVLFEFTISWAAEWLILLIPCIAPCEVNDRRVL